MSGRVANALVVLTRPEGRNEALVQALGRRGLDAISLPALEICSVAAAPGSMPQLPDYDLVVFVSGNAARHFFQQYRESDLDVPAWPAHTRAAAVGLATARAVTELGWMALDDILIPAASSSQDSESLWTVLQPYLASMRKVLIVRGQDGREWLGRKFEEAGLAVCRHASYGRHESQWGHGAVQALQSAVADKRPIICLLTSVHGVDAFISNIRRHDLFSASAGFHYVVIHPRIAGRLQSSLQIPSGQAAEPPVTICPPEDDAIEQAIASLVFS